MVTIPVSGLHGPRYENQLPNPLGGYLGRQEYSQEVCRQVHVQLLTGSGG